MKQVKGISVAFEDEEGSFVTMNYNKQDEIQSFLREGLKGLCYEDTDYISWVSLSLIDSETGDVEVVWF